MGRWWDTFNLEIPGENECDKWVEGWNPVKITLWLLVLVPLLPVILIKEKTCSIASNFCENVKDCYTKHTTPSIDDCHDNLIEHTNEDGWVVIG